MAKEQKFMLHVCGLMFAAIRYALHRIVFHIRTGRVFFAGPALLLLAACQTATLQNPEFADAQAGSVANLDSLTEVVKRSPNDPSVYNTRGAALGQAGRFEEAIADFNRALALNPLYYQAYANRGLVYRKMGQASQALQDYGQALEVNPNYAIAYIRRGNVFRLQSQLVLALDDYNRAIQIDSTNPEAFHNRGLVYQTRNLHNFAIEDFTTAIGLAPQIAIPYNARGQSYLAVNDPRSALEDFTAAVRRNRKYKQAWYNQGLALQALGRSSEAAAAFQKALAVDPSYNPAIQALASLR